MGVVGTLTGVYGADGLGFEDEEDTVCLYLSLTMLYIQVIFAVHVLNWKKSYLWLMMASEYVYQF